MSHVECESFNVGDVDVVFGGETKEVFESFSMRSNWFRFCFESMVIEPLCL